MLHEIFENIVDEIPNQVAAQYHTQRPLTYRELDEFSNRLAHHFRAKGIRTQDFVIVHLKRSIDRRIQKRSAIPRFSHALLNTSKGVL